MSTQRNTWTPSLVPGLVLFVAAASCARPPAAPDPAATAAAAVERGRYLVVAMGCNDCHTPLTMGANGPEPDHGRMLSGHPQEMTMPPAPPAAGPWGISMSVTATAFAGPWGVSYAANLTPDEETGIGAWDENLWFRVARSGRHMGAGRPILPPMPWTNMAALTDDDLRAMLAYLKSIPPIRNRVPAAVPAPAAGAAPGASLPGTAAPVSTSRRGPRHRSRVSRPSAYSFRGPGGGSGAGVDPPDGAAAVPAPGAAGAGFGGVPSERSPVGLIHGWNSSARRPAFTAGSSAARACASAIVSVSKMKIPRRSPPSRNGPATTSFPASAILPMFAMCPAWSCRVSSVTSGVHFGPRRISAK